MCQDGDIVVVCSYLAFRFLRSVKVVVTLQSSSADLPLCFMPGTQRSHFPENGSTIPFPKQQRVENDFQAQRMKHTFARESNRCGVQNRHTLGEEEDPCNVEKIILKCFVSVSYLTQRECAASQNDACECSTTSQSSAAKDEDMRGLNPGLVMKNVPGHF